jgi:hypothetical protein
LSSTKVVEVRERERDELPPDTNDFLSAIYAAITKPGNLHTSPHPPDVYEIRWRSERLRLTFAV